MIDKTNRAARAIVDYSTSLLGHSDGRSQDTTLMTDDERVRHLLEQHDGRMWQSDMVRRTDWTKYKLSRHLCRMEREGTIVRHRIGNEKLVCVPDRELSADETRRLLTGTST